MPETRFDKTISDMGWCPGCGNFQILISLKQALDELSLSPEQVVVVTGIGQAAKTNQYLKCNFFNSLHGRSIPVATGIKLSNPCLTVIAESGDGCTYGEGGNHFIHGIRRNCNITNIVHNNMIYGLTKGQASPTSMRGFKTRIHTEGFNEEPLNPVALAISLGAGFVARTFSRDIEFTKEIIKQAIVYRGYSLVDILQPCVSFNKVNTYKWFEENSEKLPESHDCSSQTEAFKIAAESTKIPLGVIYRTKERQIFEDSFSAGMGNGIVGKKPDTETLKQYIGSLV